AYPAIVSRYPRSGRPCPGAYPAAAARTRSSSCDMAFGYPGPESRKPGCHRRPGGYPIIMDEQYPKLVSDPAADGIPEYADDDSHADEEADATRIADGPDPAVSMYDRDPAQRPVGRLVAPDEGAHGDAEKDEVARDAGVSGGGASAEELAMHPVPEDGTR